MTQREKIEAWWNSADEETKRRVVEAKGDYLEPDLLTSLVQGGVIVVSDGYWSGHQSGPAGFPMPTELTRFLDEQP